MQRQIVHLVDDAVDVIAKRCALLFDLAVMRDHLLRTIAERRQRVGVKPECLKPLYRLKLRFGQRRGQGPPGIGEKRQRPCAGNLGVQLAQGSGGGVARIGKGLAPVGRLSGVQRIKIVVAHIDFAAHLKQRRCALDPRRNSINRARIGGDVFPDGTIPTGRGLHQIPVFIAQRQRQPVNLGLCGEGQRRPARESQIFADARIEIDNILILEGIAQGQHRHVMPDLAEPFRRGGTDLVAGAVSAFEAGEPFLNRLIATFQAIIFRV